MQEHSLTVGPVKVDVCVGNGDMKANQTSSSDSGMTDESKMFYAFVELTGSSLDELVPGNAGGNEDFVVAEEDEPGLEELVPALSLLAFAHDERSARELATELIARLYRNVQIERIVLLDCTDRKQAFLRSRGSVFLSIGKSAFHQRDIILLPWKFLLRPGAANAFRKAEEFSKVQLE